MIIIIIIKLYNASAWPLPITEILVYAFNIPNDNMHICCF